MNHRITFLFSLGAALLSVAVSKADIYCTTSASNNSGGAEVSYTTGGGFQVAAQSGAGG